MISISNNEEERWCSGEVEKIVKYLCYESQLLCDIKFL